MIKKIFLFFVTLILVLCSGAVTAAYVNSIDQGYSTVPAPEKIDSGSFIKSGVTVNYETWKYNEDLVKIEVTAKKQFFPGQYKATYEIKSGNGIVTVEIIPLSVPFWVPAVYGGKNETFNSNQSAVEFYWANKSRYIQ